MNKFRQIKRLVRTWYYRMIFKKVGFGTYIYGPIYVYVPTNITIGSNSRINTGCIINAKADVYIGSYVHVSAGSQIHTSGLNVDGDYKLRKHVNKAIKIEDGVWIGAGVIVNPGVTIGKGSIIGSGSVVTSDIPPSSIAVGTPARVIRRIY